jgi:site-specific DNA recombinase
VHEVRFKGDEKPIEREVPAILDRGLQERAIAALKENKSYRNRRGDRKYLLAGLVKCAVCGFACAGHSTTARGKKYHYYACIDGRTEKLRKGPPHRSPFLNAGWLEELVWGDVRRFLENPGEVLERVREQLKGADNTENLAQRREELSRRLAGKTAEKDRYIRQYARGHISEEELDVYLADFRNQTDNLRLLLESVEADLSQEREHKELAETTHAWLLTLRQRVAEVEQDTEEAYLARRQLVKLLVARITAGRRDEDDGTEVRITYRFDPPEEAGWGSPRPEPEDTFVGTVPHGLGRENAKAGQKLTSAAALYAVGELELWRSSYALIPPTSRMRKD